MNTAYRFTAILWQYKGKGAWYFVSLPLSISTEIKSLYKMQEEGWGRLKIKAQLGNSQWDTAIWWDSKSNTYLLPIKSAIRNAEKIMPGEEQKITIWV